MSLPKRTPIQVAQESLSALRTVQAFNAAGQEQEKFHQKVGTVLTLARKEAIASGIFFGATGWSGNVTLLALLGYGESVLYPIAHTLSIFCRWDTGQQGSNLGRRPDESAAVHGIRR